MSGDMQPAYPEKSPDKVGDTSTTAAKVKYEWYQTESDVIVTIHLKNVNRDDVTANYATTSLSLNVKLSTASVYCLDLELAHPIVPDKCSFKVTPSKIEVKLRKTEGLRWAELEGKGVPFDVKPITSDHPDNHPAAKAPSYPTSYTKGPKNWDKIAQEAKKEEEDEQLEGDAAVNKLFQKIYADADDNVKRAMMKSFTESKGTVLSTNWEEVGDKKVDCKPPDSMEWKQYQ